MCCTCVHAEHMSRMIQLRNVPDNVHRTLKSQAALAGMSLSDFLLAEIRHLVERPTIAELRKRVRHRARVAGPAAASQPSAESGMRGDCLRCFSCNRVASSIAHRSQHRPADLLPLAVASRPSSPGRGSGSGVAAICSGQSDYRTERTRTLEDLNDLPLNRYPHDVLIPRIWELRTTLKAYDGAYVALAELLDVPLLTCDGKIASAPGHNAKVEVV